MTRFPTGYQEFKGERDRGMKENIAKITIILFLGLLFTVIEILPLLHGDWWIFLWVNASALIAWSIKYVGLPEYYDKNTNSWKKYESIV